MKHLILLKTAALLLITAQSFATVRIVDNSVNSPAPYSTIQDAINDSSPGDTVYVQGSGTPYDDGSVTIDRRITLIGAGYNVTGTQFNMPVNIQNTYGSGSIVFDSSATQNDLSGTKIIGINTALIVTAGNTHLHNVTIDRCYIRGGSNNTGLDIYGSNWIVKNCVVAALNFLSESNNAFISNNILGYTRSLSSGALGIVITNNFVYHPFYQIRYANISNNVFWTNTLVSPSDLQYCVFNNNITYDSLYGASLLPLANSSNNIGNTGSDNLNNTDPNFVNVPSNNFTLGGVLSGYDFSYQSGSPAINAGTDGTDIGISGGAYPMTQWTGAPPIPQMQELNVLNAIIDQDQPLDINFKARKMD